MSEKVDVVVVGAGLAGLGAAYHLSAAGLEVLVVERGDYPGSKNVTGGRLYLGPVRPYYPELFAEDKLADIPFERSVVKERFTLTAANGGTTIELHAPQFNGPPPHSLTLLRAEFDSWLASQADDRGAIVVPGYKVDDLLWEGERIVGIQSAGDEIRSDVVVAADGALSFIAEKAGLRDRHDPADFALGVKEILELPAEMIEERFGLGPGQGAAQLAFGSISQGMMGGGFIYTNKQSLSIGMVVGMGAMISRGPSFQAHELLDAFKSRPEIAPLIAGGRVLEYSAHAIPEATDQAMPRLVRDGLVVVGDAAGFALNMGVTVRGMDFALASGALAAEAILEAKEREDFGTSSLASYETKLQRSFIRKDLKRFAGMHRFLQNPRLYRDYPEMAYGLLESLLKIDEAPKPGLFRSALRAIRGVSLVKLAGDFLAARRL